MARRPVGSGRGTRLGSADRSIARRATGFVGLFVFVLLAFSIYEQSRQRRALLEAGERRASNLSHILSEHLDRSVNAIEATLRQIGQQWRDGSADADMDWDAMLGTALAGLPSVGSISITDASGRVRYATNPALVGLSWADTEVFRRAREQAGSQFLAGTIARHRLRSGELLVPLLHRLAGPAGGFDGTIIATLIPDRLRAFYRSVDVGLEGALRLLHPGGQFLFRQPPAPVSESLDLRDNVLAVVQTGRARGVLRIDDLGSGKSGIAGFSVADASGLIVLVQLADRDLLRLWRGNLIVNAAIVSLLVAALIAAIIILLRALAGRRQAEARLVQAQKMEAIGQLTGGIAHDFNNLMTVVLGASERLKQMFDADSDGAKLAGMIVAAGERAANLTGQLLAFSRRQLLRPARVDVNALIAGMQGLLRQSLGAEIAIEFVTARPVAAINVDPTQLETSILNLAINARDAMPAGGQLTIETYEVTIGDDHSARDRDLRPGRYVVVAVSDSGTGMPPELLDQVFEPFFTTKQPGKGTGLGLSMVFGFVRQSGGHVRIYSEVDHGTTVRLYLPAALDAAAPIDTGTVTDREVRGGDETVLLVEDDPLVSDLVTAQLRGLGYTVIAANDGASALTALHSTPHVDLLLTDMVLPRGMDGRELARHAAARRPELRVLYISGYTATAMTRNGRLDPGMRILPKPFSREQLAHGVRDALDG